MQESKKNDSVDGVDVKTLVKERRRLERVAENLGVEKFDEMDDADLKKAVIKADAADATLDGKSAEYINARFDIVAEKHEKSTGKAQDLGNSLNKAGDQTKNDAADARQKAMDRAANAWKEPLRAHKN